MSDSYNADNYFPFQIIEKLPEIKSKFEGGIVLGYKLIKRFDEYDVYEIRTATKRTHSQELFAVLRENKNE